MIETSAILHKAQRELNTKGRIVATLADYGHAHAAFDAGLAALYRTKIPETALAVVRAAEAMGAKLGVGVKITVSALMAKLGIAGRGVAAARLRDAEERGFLKLVETDKGYGRTSARIYELGKTSAEVATLIETGVGTQCVFPPVEDVEREIIQGPLSSRYKGTAGIGSENVNEVKGRSVPADLGTDASPKATEDPVLSKIVPSVPLYQGKGRDDFRESDDDAGNLSAFAPGRDGLI
jgi:hypothetical protein